MKKTMIFLLALGLIVPLFANAQEASFEDVHSLHINKDAIEYLKNTDVVEGYEDETYKPENRINRAEFVKIIVASQIQNPTGSYCFKDVKNEWFAKYICTAKRVGWISGYPDGTFKPADMINFAEASKIISNAMKVEEDKEGTRNEWFAGFVKGLENRKAIPSTVHFFDKDVSRGEMAEVIWRLKTNKTDKISQTYDEITQEFPAIKSCSALQEKFNEYQSDQYRNYRSGTTFFGMEEPMMLDMAEGAEAMAPMAAKSTMSLGEGAGSLAATDFSQTNIQVRGVDEADIIKNDGKYIYMIKDNTVRIIEAFPPNEMKEVSKLDYTEDGFRPREMFLDANRLVVIGQEWSSYPTPIPLIEPTIDIEPEIGIMPRYPYYRGSKTKVIILDISSKSQPKVERKVKFDGDYHTSRRINDDVYLVLNNRPHFWALSDMTKGEELLPKFQDGDGDEKPMVGCTDIRYFPGHAKPNYLIAVSIPLDQPKGEIKRKVFLGSSDNVYASRTHMYVASSEVNYDHFTDWDWSRDRTHTLVFKFALEDGDINYKSRGRVPGRILNQFSMDAHIDHFRIATTIDQWSRDQSSNNVYVLDKDMKTVGSIEGIAPGERIFSTRFLGDRLYMVTFRQVDPLFVIDLSVPEAPKILGSLKIPGFSDYLHPFDKDHIIGFGKDTITDEKDRALMQGFKMALFDVSDVENPIQKFSEVIGDRGTNSELLRNHKALLFDKEKNLLAFPINIVEKVNPEELECSKNRYSTCPSLCQRRCIPSECSEDAEGKAVCTDDCDGLGSCIDPSYERYNTTFVGAVAYTLDENTGFDLRGRITHYDDEDLLKMGDYFPYNHEKNIQRIIYIGDYFYSISPAKVKASDIDDTDEVNSIKID